MKHAGKRVLSFMLGVLLIVSVLPTISFAKTGDTPITGFSATDNSFVEGDLEWGDQYNLDYTDYTVTTNDGESYTGPMWDVFGWLNDKYPGLEFDGYVNWDKSDDPSNGKAGDSFKIVYYLDGFEAEWTLHIVEDPISEVTAGDITHIETDKYQVNDYRDAEGNWHDAEWLKYDFTPQLRIVLKNGEEYWDEIGMPDMVADWLLEQTGIRFRIDWNDDWGQNPPTGVGVGEYPVTYHVGSHSGTYKGIVVENPIKNVEVREVKRLEGDTFLENGYNGEDEWHDEKWPKYNFSPYIKVTLTNGQVFEDEDPRKITDWVNEQTGLEIFPWWDDNTCQNPPYGIGVGEYTIEYEFGGFSGTYKASVIKNPIVSMTCDPTKIEIFEGNRQERIGYMDTDGGWDEDIKWYAYDTYPHCMTVKTADGQSIENADWWDCRQWLEQKYGLTFQDRFEGDTQTPTSEWGVGEYPVTFGFGSASMNYTVSIVANPIQSVSAEGMKRLEGDKDTRDEYWDEQGRHEEKWEAYATWPRTIKVVTTKGTFEGDPNDVRRNLMEILGKTEDEINRMGFGDMNDDQSPTSPWDAGIHHERFNVCGTYADYDIEIVENPIKSVKVEDITVFEGNTRTEHGYWGPDGKWIDVDWERYDCWPSKIVVEMKKGDPYEGDPHHVYEQVKNLVGFDFNFGDREDGQSPDQQWKVGNHEVKFVFGGNRTTYNVAVVADPFESVTVNSKMYLTEGDTYTEDGYWNDKGERIDVQWQKYGYLPQDITVKVKQSALKKGTKTTFTGHAFEVRKQVAEAIGINEDDIRLECYDDQSPENLWGAGEHDSVFNFSGKTCELKVVVVAFPVAKVSADRVVIDEDDPKVDLDCSIDFETGREIYYEQTFKGYDPKADEITITFKNGVKKTGDPGTLQEEVLEMMAGEAGASKEDIFFGVYAISDQSPDAGWTPGYHMARFNFGPVKGDYEVVLLGENGDYTGLYNDSANNRYIYLKEGFFNPAYNGEIRSAVADVIDKKDPAKTKYVENSQGVYDVKNGIVQGNKKDVKKVFTDIPEKAWFVSAVQFAYDYGIMTGKGGKFDPTGTLKREEFVQMLYSMSGKPDVPSGTANPFKDVKSGQWYTNAVLWAHEKGYAAGNSDGTFGIGKNIQRQALVSMLYKYAEANGYDMSYDAKAIKGYKDTKNVSDWAVQSFSWAVSKGIISGKGAAGETDKSKIKLDPTGNATRSECAAMMLKLQQMKK